MRICEVEPFESAFINVWRKKSPEQSQNRAALTSGICLPHGRRHKCYITSHFSKCPSRILLETIAKRVSVLSIEARSHFFHQAYSQAGFQSPSEEYYPIVGNRITNPQELCLVCKPEFDAAPNRKFLTTKDITAPIWSESMQNRSMRRRFSVHPGPLRYVKPVRHWENCFRDKAA